MDIDIRECYRNELNRIKHNKSLDEEILVRMNTLAESKVSFKWLDRFRRNKTSKSGIWKSVAVAAVLFCAISVSLNLGIVVSYAESILGRFSLFLAGEEIRLSELTPIAFPLDIYLADEGTKKVHTSYSKVYPTQEQLQERTGIVLEKSDELELANIVLNISPEHKTGHMTMRVFCDSKEVHMNGMFVIDGYDEGEYGYGTEKRAYYIYEYGEGDNAYFVKSGQTQGIYFTKGGIMYQLFVEDSKEGKEFGKKIVDCMAE